MPKRPAAHWYGQPVKFVGDRDKGNGGTHEPSGQLMVVDGPRTSIAPDGHEDSDEATEMFRRVTVPVLSILHPTWVRSHNPALSNQSAQ